MMSAGARVRALVGDACHSDLARRKAAFWRALCIVGPGSAVGQPAALVWRRARHSRRWQSVCCTIHTSCRPAALGSDQSCLAMAYMCVSLDVRCTKINLQTGTDGRHGIMRRDPPGPRPPLPPNTRVASDSQCRHSRGAVPGAGSRGARTADSSDPSGSGAQLHNVHTLT
jgi:hypothetical protein